MTHHTDTERQAFEAVASDYGACPKAIERDAKGNYLLMHTATGWMWWQAARRAPAVPVPQGWKLVPDADNMTDEQAEAICNLVSCCGGGAHEVYEAALAAAPQPPEAQGSASNVTLAVRVQMPEPAEFQVRIRPTWNANHHWTIWEKCTPEAAADYERTPLLHEWKYEVRKLYTEQQVRQLLAAHGIQEQST